MRTHLWPYGPCYVVDFKKLKAKSEDIAPEAYLEGVHPGGGAALFSLPFRIIKTLVQLVTALTSAPLTPAPTKPMSSPPLKPLPFRFDGHYMHRRET